MGWGIALAVVSMVLIVWFAIARRTRSGPEDAASHETHTERKRDRPAGPGAESERPVERGTTAPDEGSP